MNGMMKVRTKIAINDNITVQVSSFNYTGYIITLTDNGDLEIKMDRFNQMCNTIRGTLNITTQENGHR
jgi:hypothetical protein